MTADSQIITDPNAPLPPADTAGAAMSPQELAKRARIKAITTKVAATFDGEQIDECFAALISCLEGGAKSSNNPLMLVVVAANLRSLADELERTQRERAILAGPSANQTPA